MIAKPAGLCRLAAELVEQALGRIPVVDTRSVSTAPQAVAAVDRTLARSFLTIALEQLHCADTALLPYVAADRGPVAPHSPLCVLDGGAE